jgi:hypothetical protein
MLTRRSFLVGAGAGLITPWLLDRFRNYLEVHGEPLILAPENSNDSNTLFVSPGDGFLVTSAWTFRTTWRQILGPNYCHAEDAETFARWGVTENQLDDEISSDAYITWSSQDLVVGGVCDLLKSLDLGSHLSRPGSAGGIRFERQRGKGGIEFAYCDDLLSVSLLQARLNELGTGLAVNLV